METSHRYHKEVQRELSPLGNFVAGLSTYLGKGVMHELSVRWS